MVLKESNSTGAYCHWKVWTLFKKIFNFKRYVKFLDHCFPSSNRKTKHLAYFYNGIPSPNHLLGYPVVATWIEWKVRISIGHIRRGSGFVVYRMRRFQTDSDESEFCFPLRRGPHPLFRTMSQRILCHFNYFFRLEERYIKSHKAFHFTLWQGWPTIYSVGHINKNYGSAGHNFFS